MTTKTREESIEEVKRQVEIQQKNNGLCGQLEYTDRSVFARCFKGGEFFNVVEEFTPLKPEFELGTIGLESRNELVFYLHGEGDRHMVTCKQDVLKGIEGGGYTTSTFTPIYQTDPIEKRAFEMLARDYSLDLKHNHIPARYFDSRSLEIERFKAHFLSRAKGELSK